MGVVANFIRFPAVQKIENRLTFDKVTESLKVGTFFETQCICTLYRHSDLDISKLTASPPKNLQKLICKISILLHFGFTKYKVGCHLPS